MYLIEDYHFSVDIVGASKPPPDPTLWASVIKLQNYFDMLNFSLLPQINSVATRDVASNEPLYYRAHLL